MTIRSRGFVKRAPCSRATRIRRLIAHLPFLRRKESPDLRRIFKSVMGLLTYSHDRTEVRFDQITTLMEKIPTWMDWTEREDVIFGPTLAKLLNKGAEVTDQKYVPHSPGQDDIKYDRDLVAKHLIQENGDHEYMDENDFLDAGPRLKTLYLFWLQSQSAPSDSLAHIRDEDGIWLRDENVRERVRAGWIVDIPMRMVRRRRPSAIPPTPIRSSTRRGGLNDTSDGDLTDAPVRPRHPCERDVCKHE